MRRTSFLWVLYASYAVLILLTTAIAGVLVSRQQEKDALAQTEQSLLARAELLREIARPEFHEGRGEIQKVVRRAGRGAGVRLTIIDEGGKVMADSDKRPSEMNNHIDRPEIVLARENGAGMSTRYSRTVGIEMMYVGVALYDGERIIGYARASVPLTDIHERLARTRTLIAVSAGIAALVGLVLGFLFARGLTRRLTRITRAAETIAGGEYDLEVPTGARDEFGRLGAAFNDMARQLKERMATIARERNQVLAILGSMVEGVVAVDADQTVVHINVAAAEMLGLERESCIGEPIWQSVRVPALNDAAESVLSSGEPDRRDATVVGERGSVQIELRSAPLVDSRGKLAGAVLVLSDVTELRRLETVRRDFVSNVSHELKTPLAAIQALVETLLDDEEMDRETARGFLARIEKQSERLNAIVLDLLSLSRLESEAHRVERSPVDLREVIRACLDMQQTVAGKRSIAITSALPESEVRVLADVESMQQLLGNLLDNALKYTPEGGRVEIRLTTQKSRAIVEVQDTGVGIPPEHLHRIFERFYRVDRARSREVGGTGLGLAIVKHIALAHGGIVDVQSNPGKGSTFTVRLPLAET